MTSVISERHLESPMDSIVSESVFYRSITLDSSVATRPWAIPKGRLLSGRSQVQLLSGAPKSHRPICKSAAKSVIPRVIGRHGSRYIVEIRVRGKPTLRYLTGEQLRGFGVSAPSEP